MTIQESLVPPYADPQDKLYAERTRLLARIGELEAALNVCADDGFWKPKSAPLITAAAEELLRRADIARAALSPPIEGPTG